MDKSTEKEMKALKKAINQTLIEIEEIKGYRDIQPGEKGPMGLPLMTKQEMLADRYNHIAGLEKDIAILEAS